jgi:hypothetical protein
LNKIDVIRVVMNRKIYLTLLLALVAGWSTAQSNFGEIRGKVVDAKTKKPLDYMNILVTKDGINKGGSMTDENGNYYIKALEPGTYNVIAKYVDYKNYEEQGVSVRANNITYVNIEMSKDDGQVLNEVVVKKWKTPLVEGDRNSKSFSDKDIQKLPTRSIGAIAATASGVSSTNAGVSFIGQRSDGTRYFVDGVPVVGSTNLPQAAQGQIDIIQSGIPAQFGDFTGGAISITTKGPSAIYRKSFEVISSSMFDKYHYNQAEGFISGPLKIKNKGGGTKEFVQWGFQLAGNINYSKDPNPAFSGMYVVNDNKLNEIEQNPLVANPLGGGFVPSSSFVTKNDMVLEKARRNVAQIRGVVQGKLEYQPNQTTNITFFGSYNYQTNDNFSYANYLLNYKNFSQSIAQTYRTYIKFTQKFRNEDEADKAKKEKKNLFTDAFYTVRLDYQASLRNTFAPLHGSSIDNIFDYGYVGKFSRYRVPAYSYNDNTQLYIDQKGDTVSRRGFWELSGFRDTLIRFTPGDKNEFITNYTENFFNNASNLGQRVTSENQILQGQGVLNGYGIPNTYSLFFNPGNITSNYSKSMFERISAYAMGEASLNLKNKHDLQFGMTYEQNIASGYGISASSLWRLMPLLANSHIDQLDKTTTGSYVNGGIHSYDQNGNFLDTINYAIRVNEAAQTTFDKNLRAKLMEQGARDVNGDLIGKTSFIDINSLDPSTFNIKMFSANDLWNNGNSFVSYYGYDYKGNRDRKKPSLAQFLNDKENRSIGSFAPIYSAAWLQDKFAFKDLILRVGVRVERYDANQFVLKDNYSLYPIKTVGEVKELNGQAVSHPGSVGSDYSVYVNNTSNPTEIIGYRKENVWYDANGLEVSSPDFLANKTTSGRIQPYLVESDNQELSSKSFKDYAPQINVLPRVWFSFPINTEAQFFANYDVMAQRPTDGATFAPINSIYYLEATQGGTIANSGLKPRVRTNYELGFKQLLTENSALSIIASYSETRGDYGLMRINQAYPIPYNTYGNIDFSTTKAFRVEYELRELGNASVTANYSLLFADGTGSNINSQQALIAANQPNLRTLYPMDVDIRHKLVAILDYRFDEKDRYSGVMIGKFPVFADAGVNFNFNARSGAPFTSYKQAVSEAQADLGRVQRSQIDGNPYGSRMPWQYKVDMNFSKTFFVTKKQKSINKSDKYEIKVYLWVQNLLNQKAIDQVYQYTGLASDDGYLSSPQGQQYITEQASRQSFVDLYSTKVNNPYNFTAPRQTRLGIKMSF